MEWDGLNVVASFSIMGEIWLVTRRETLESSVHEVLLLLLID
jgi:hypothetical protein